MTKHIKLKESINDDFEKYYKIKDEKLVNLDIDENGNLIVSERGFTEGFLSQNKWITKSSSEVWKEVDLQRLYVRSNYFGYGVDKVTAMIDENVVELIESRWEGQSDCYVPVESVGF